MADQQVQDITPVYYHVLLALRDPDEDELDAVRVCTRIRTTPPRDPPADSALFPLDRFAADARRRT